MAGNFPKPSGIDALSPEARKHQGLYKTTPNSKKNHRQKCLEVITSRRKERQAKMVEAFRQLRTSDGLSDVATKQEIIRQATEQMMADFDNDFSIEGSEEGIASDYYRAILLVELERDYEQILEQETIEEEQLAADLEAIDFYLR